MKNILVFNATGAQGNTIAQKLMQEGNQVIAPARSEEKVSQLKSQGVEGHLTDFSTSSLAPIIKKADQVVLQIPAAIAPNQMVEISENAMRAIQEAGYPKTVFVISSTIPKDTTGVSSVDARVKMKELAKKHLPKTPILSSTEYLENFSTAYREPILEHNIIPQTIPSDKAVNYLSWLDLAKYVSAALKSDKLEGKVYPIGGLEGLSGGDLSERLGKILDKKLMYVPVTYEQQEQALTPFMGAAVAKDYAEFYQWQDGDGAYLLNPDTSEIRNLLGVNLDSFETWAEQAFEG
jgi:uncharacterized protein YbjT (DUF2867 family)